MEVTEKYGHWINSVIIGELSRSSLRFHGGHWESGAKCIIPHGYGVFFFSYVEPGGNSMLADGYSRLFHMWGFFLNFLCGDWLHCILIVNLRLCPVILNHTLSHFGEYLFTISQEQAGSCTYIIFGPIL